MHHGDKHILTEGLEPGQDQDSVGGRDAYYRVSEEEVTSRSEQRD